MNKRTTGIVSLSLTSLLALAGCAQPSTEAEEGAIDVIGDTSVIDVIEDELANIDTITADAKSLFFDHGFYAFTYTEEPLDVDVSGKVEAEGIISFREDGTCAFEATGVQTLSDRELSFTYVKDFRQTASLRFEGQDFDLVDPAEFEATLSLKLPPLGPFPRTADFSGFCGLQSMSEYVERAGRETGTGLINAEKANNFVKRQLDVYHENVYETLGISEYSPEEAREVRSITYLGAEDLMPVWDGLMRFGTDEATGNIVVSNGLEGETNVATMVMEPRSSGSRERALEYVQEYAGNWNDQLEFFLETYGSGDEYIKELEG